MKTITFVELHPHEWLVAVPGGKNDYWGGFDGKMPRWTGQVSSWVKNINEVRRKEEET